MITSYVVYEGELHTRLTHERSGEEVINDAPVDNNGIGDAFSPTDLMVTSLASCMLTMMGIKCVGMKYDLEGAACSVAKVMANDPRRVAEIRIEFELPQGADKKTRKILENVALTCPVAESIHPEILQKVEFNWR
jgi:uncharacterized OsmC-like protein